MQLYLAQDKVKSGPFSRFQVLEKLSSGEIAPEDLGWHEGLDGWKPLLEIPLGAEIIAELVAEKDAETEPADSEKSTPPSVQEIDEELGCKQVRPFVRYFARSLDLAVYSSIVWIALGGYPIAELSAPPEESDVVSDAFQYVFLVQTLLFLSWNFIEAYLLSTYGTTLGKLLLRVDVRRSDGALPDYRTALARAFHVWFAGFAFGLPILREIAQAICLARILREGITPWDRSLDLRVRHHPVGAERTIITALIFVAVIVSLSVASAP